MAEYIDREQVLELQADYGEGQYTMMLVDPKLVKKLPTADVVEREEYERLKIVNLDLARTNKALLEERNDLHSKIDKAIDEIENQKKFNTECDGESDLGIAIQIIRKYLGE